MKDYRIIFEKKGISKYISHLDLNRCMIRAIRRSGLPAWYTEGFHPHLYLMFPLALSLGTESICEVMDFRLTEELPPEEILEKLNSALPDGLHAVSVGEPHMQATDITAAEYLVKLSAPEIPDLKSVLENFLNQPEILIQKKTKKGLKEIDIKPMLTIKNIDMQEQNLFLTAILPAGNDGNLNINVLTDAFQNYADKPIFIKSACRTKIFSENYQDFF
ncbi:MAG: TIGR03936 family radical SAM-associated protein [Oscillospiraceae bacterium]|nr:TIGR03936 family radical SAM-associated protein [Oscillospiraceae bacterium]